MTDKGTGEKMRRRGKRKNLKSDGKGFFHYMGRL